MADLLVICIGQVHFVLHSHQIWSVSLGAFVWSRPKFKKIFWTWSREHMVGWGEEAELSSGGILITSELSSLNFHSSVWAEQSFAMRYPNIVIKSLCGNLGICVNNYANAYFQSRNSARVLSVADHDRKSFYIALSGRAVGQFSNRVLSVQVR